MGADEPRGIEAGTRRASERIISAVSRRLALAQAESLDPVIESGLAEVASHLGADGAALLRVAPDDSIEYVATWFDPAVGPLPFRTEHRSKAYDWVRERIETRGPQVVDMREILARVGAPSSASNQIRFVALIGTFTGDRVVGTLCLYYRRATIQPEASDLEPYEVLGDILHGAVSRRDAEVALRESEVRYRTIVETSAEGIWTMTADWRVSFANARIAKMLGYTVDELVGRPLLDFVAAERHPSMHRNMAARERGTADVIETTYRRKDGSSVQVRIAASPLLDDSGRFVGALGMVEDITEELRLRAELAAARRLEAIGQLAGGVAHDINNALTVILAQAARGKRMVTGAPLVAFTEIESAGHRASEVARQLLAFARRESVQPRPLDLGALVRQLAPMLKQLVGSHIALELDVQPDSWPVYADPTQVERVLLNLAANSRDAMLDGGTLSVRIANRRVGRGSRVVEGDYVTIEVRDTGHGMSEDVLARALEPFFTTKADRGGTGLGLASAYGAMKQIGGELEIASTSSAGTVVMLYCPRSQQPVEPSHEGAPATTPGGHRILYVEDLAPVRDVVAQTLADAGYSIMVASDGEQALRIAAESRDFDALVTDVVMPGMTGYKLAASLRVKHPSLRVLYLSGYDRPHGLEDALAEPATGFLAKPFSPEALLDELARLLTAG